LGPEPPSNKPKKNKLSDKEKKERKEKVEEMIQNDSTYNLVMKLAHRITNKDNFESLKKLIPEESVTIIEKAFNNKSILFHPNLNQF
jgi:hypothetical protein